MQSKKKNVGRVISARYADFRKPGVNYYSFCSVLQVQEQKTPVF